ncbi:Tripartite motif containing 37, partial [Pichia californica]
MSHSGIDSGEVESATNTDDIPLLDDTLSRKLPSLTFEKFIRETNGDKNNQSSNVNQPKDMEENDEINDITEFELNLNGGSPALKDFKNPFDDSPETTDLKKKLETSADDSILFKTPSKIDDVKRMPKFTRDYNSMNTLPSTTPINAFEEFRAMRDRQAHNATFGFNNLEASNIGLVVDVRKVSQDGNEDNSMDDSSIRLNLIPTDTRFQRNLNLHETPEATQVDGNVHDEVIQLLKDRNSKQNIYDGNKEEEEEVEEEQNLLKSLNRDKRYSLSSNDTGYNDDEKLSSKSMNERQVNSEENNEIKDNSTPIIKDTLDITEKNSQNKSDIDIDPKTPSQQKVGFCSTDILIEYSPNISSKALNTIEFRRNEDLVDRNLKETQVIDNFSQSIVLDDEDEDNVDSACIMQKKRIDYGDDIDDDDEEIKTGRNILQTFRIENESQSQSQLESQPELEIQLQSSSQEKIPHRPQFEVQEETNYPIVGVDDIEVHGSEVNSSFGIPDTQPLNIPETLKINTQGMEKDHIPNIEHLNDIDLKLQASSPVKLIGNDQVNDNSAQINSNNIPINDVSENEIPNTSAVSISKLYFDETKTEKKVPRLRNNNLIPDISKATSTPLLLKKKNINNIEDDNYIGEISGDKSTYMMNRLCDALREEITDNVPLDNTSEVVIEREKRGKTYKITDVLDFNCVFIMLDASTRLAGRITKMVESDDSIYVNVKIRDGDVIIEHTKIYAPVCFDIGDPVKYFNDKKHNYVVTGLKRTKNKDKDMIDEIETIGGFNKLLITKNQKNSKEKLKEIEVDLTDIYLTSFMCRQYKHKLFNDSNDFQKYLDYQIRQFALNSDDNGKYSYEINGDDTLINLLPASRSRSLVSNKNRGPFSKCLFVVTGLVLPNAMKPGSRGDSKNNTPRHQRDRELQQIIGFIQSQGGIVLHESGFEDIIKFKLKETLQKKKIGNGINISPRKVKIMNNNGFDDTDLKNKKNGNEFTNYECSELTENGEYYKIKFGKEGDSIDIDEDLGNFEFGCVISSHHLRTLKYLECLCLKWPIIHVEFIKKCMEKEEFLQNWKREWTKFLLISGESTSLNCCIGLDIFSYFQNWINGEGLGKQLQLNKLFHGCRVIIIGDTHQ